MAPDKIGKIAPHAMVLAGEGGITGIADIFFEVSRWCVDGGIGQQRNKKCASQRRPRLGIDFISRLRPLTCLQRNQNVVTWHFTL